MALQICHETLLDGIILIFQDFRTVTFCTNFMVPSNVLIQRVLNTYYRSSTVFSYYKKLIKVSFGFHNDMPLDVVVAYRKVQTIPALGTIIGSSESDNEGSHDQSEITPKNEFSVIRECFIEAINYSARKIGCWQHQCCKRYEEVIKRKACSCYNNRYITDRHDSATKFGLFFKDKFQTLLREKLRNNRLDVIFTVRDVGQNLRYSRASLILQRYNLKFVKELIIHCSRDYWVPNYALLWDARHLKKLHHRPKMEYYPGLIKGHGNFYYEHKHNGMEEAEIKLRKYYSQLFKEADNKGTRSISPFSQAILKNFLCEKYNLAKNIDYKQWLDCVEEILNSYSESNYMYCREELIGSSMKLSNERLEHILLFFKDELLPYQNSSKYFSHIKKERFLTYITGFMEPLVSCIRREVDKKLAFEAASRFYFITDGKI